jgi:hypothetical protein
MPEDKRAEAVSTLRKGDSLQYQAALAELTVHAALIREGYVTEVHPACSHPTRKPDFLVKLAQGAPLVFVEVTSFTPDTEERSQANRDADIYNALDKTKLPAGWRLGLDIVKHGDNTPAVTKLRQSVEAWATEAAGGDSAAMPVKTFDLDGWSIELTLYGGFKKDVAPERVIASAMGDVRTISPELEIRQALEQKGSRYGAMTIPYLVVVADCKGELRGGHRIGEALLDAVFGTVVTQVSTTASGKTTVEDKRILDGYWGRPDQLKHRNVSGVLILPKPHLWDLRSERWQPLLLRNPWAEYPLPDNFLARAGFRLTESNGIAPTEGKRFADILGLPEVWPPEEAA